MMINNARLRLMLRLALFRGSPYGLLIINYVFIVLNPPFRPNKISSDLKNFSYAFTDGLIPALLLLLCKTGAITKS